MTLAWDVLKRVALLLVGICLGLLLWRAKGFTVPTAEGNTLAIGSLQDLPETLQRVFTPGDGFTLLRSPKPGDWLSVFPEPGQTFDRYSRSSPNLLRAPRNVIYLQPLGAFQEETSPSLQALQEFASLYFVAEVRLLPTRDLGPNDFSPRTNPRTHNRQLLTTDILEALKASVPADAYCLLAVTMQDLYPDPSWNFVFGQATLTDRVGVFSFARYDPAFMGIPRGPGWKELILRRSCKVLVHEAGHMFGMLHCVFFDCLMNGSNHLQESDSRPMHLCPVCLRKLQFAVSFDPVERYRQLGSFSRKAGFLDEAEWIEHRLAFIGSGPSSSVASGTPAPPGPER